MLLRTLTRTYSIDALRAESAGQSEFRRVLGLWQLIAIGLGGIIGAGIFVLTGVVAATQAGPAVALSFVIAGVASAAAALCYAEFVGMIPVAGSAYTYGYAVLGEGVAWIIGWDLLLEYALVVAIGWSAYVQAFLGNFGVTLPVWAQGAPGTGAGLRWISSRSSAVSASPAFSLCGRRVLRGLRLGHADDRRRRGARSATRFAARRHFVARGFAGPVCGDGAGADRHGPLRQFEQRSARCCGL